MINQEMSAIHQSSPSTTVEVVHTLPQHEGFDASPLVFLGLVPVVYMGAAALAQVVKDRFSHTTNTSEG